MTKLPAHIRKALPPDAQETWRTVWAEAGGDDPSQVIKAEAAAWLAVREGWQPGPDGGEWVRKSGPTPSDVHADAPLGTRKPKRKKLPADVSKADYQGREVELDKPFRLPSGQTKKFGVYVKDGDAVKKVTFGDPNMEIRRDDSEARANFRARHNCSAQKDKTSAAYWACRLWESDKTVSESVDKFEVSSEAQVLKVDQSLGLVFGWALVSKVDGEDYFDTQNDHVPEEALMKAALDFADLRVGKEMHTGDQCGSIPFIFPLTTDVAKSLNIETNTTGLLIAMKPSADVLAKYESGEYTGFSIGGQRIQDEVITDE